MAGKLSFDERLDELDDLALLMTRQAADLLEDLPNLAGRPALPGGLLLDAEQMLGGHGSAGFDHSIFGYLTNAVDTAGRVTRQSRHATGQLASHARQADNGQWATVTFDHDQQMDALRIRDPLDREVERYALDAIGRATNVWDIENRPMAIRYALGDLVSGIDRFDGSTVSFDYDGGARLSRATYPDSELAFTHLACGRIASASNAVSYLAWNHDGAGRLTNETALTALGASSLSQQLDPSGLPSTPT